MLNIIGRIHSPYKEKFAIPRQSGLVPSCKAELEILSPYDDPNAFKGLEAFSHIWLLFLFHKNKQNLSWSPMVRPPRLGGNKAMGVFATRSPNRPNEIGLSLATFHGCFKKEGKTYLKLSGVDLLNETPIIDIKPYVPYADSIPSAKGGFANTKPPVLSVVFSLDAQQSIRDHQQTIPELERFLIEVLQQDPRPAYKKLKPDSKIYHVLLFDLSILWKVTDSQVFVVSINPAT